jgi:hypothetical protein
VVAGVNEYNLGSIRQKFAPRMSKGKSFCNISESFNLKRKKKPNATIDNYNTYTKWYGCYDSLSDK